MELSPCRWRVQTPGSAPTDPSCLVLSKPPAPAPDPPPPSTSCCPTGTPCHRGRLCWCRGQRRAAGRHCSCPVPAGTVAPPGASVEMGETGNNELGQVRPVKPTGQRLREGPHRTTSGTPHPTEGKLRPMAVWDHASGRARTKPPVLPSPPLLPLRP